MFNRYIAICLLLLVSLVATAQPEAPKNFLPIVKKTSQNANNYLPYFANQRLVSPRQQAAYAYNFLQHFFSPWLREPSFFAVRQQTNAAFKQFYRHPGWRDDHRPHSQYWIRDIINNAHLNHFPNHIENAIVTNATALRILPTAMPSYTNWTTAGEGYPFDNLQQSLLSPNTPIKVFHISRDGKWALVSAPEASGWIKTSDLALINKADQIAFMRANSYVTALKDKGKWHIGTIYPVMKTTTGQDCIVIAINSANHRALLQAAIPPKGLIAAWPLPATPRVMAQLVNQVMGEPYRWGGLEGHRDCSATTRDLIAAVGIWLPRNSTAQLQKGNVYYMKRLSRREKQKVLSHKARPWLTLVGHPGHVMLYIGAKQGEQYVFHNKWGLVTYHPVSGSGRAIIGVAAITPLSLGDGYSNIYFNLLDSITIMAVLG